MKTKNRVLAFTLALVTMLLLAAPALAADEQMYATNALNVRSGPGTRYAIVGELAKGEAVTVTKRSGNWAYITYGANAKGYASRSYLAEQPVSAPSLATGDLMQVTSAANVRASASTSSAKLGQVAVGDKVKKLGVSGAWTLIEWGTGIAYVASAHLSAAPSTLAPSTNAYNELITTAAVNARTGPGTRYPIAGAFDRGDLVYGTGVYTDGWTQVMLNGSIAYISSSYARMAKPSEIAGNGIIMYTKAKNVTMYDQPNVMSTRRAFLDIGQEVTALGTTGNWTTIQYGSRVGYVRSYYLTDAEYNVKTKTGVVYATSSVRVYSGPGTKYEYLGYLYSGETAARTGEAGSWTQIEFEGTKGYVQSARVRAVSTSTMRDAGYYMYAKQFRTYSYSIPMASTSYRMGYFNKGDSVWVVSRNSSWAQVVDDDVTMYIPANALSENPVYGSLYRTSYDAFVDEYVTLRSDTRVYESRTFDNNYDQIDQKKYAVVQAVDGNWIKVKYQSVNASNTSLYDIGWVHSSDVIEFDD